MSGWLTLDQYRAEWEAGGDGDPYYRPEFLAASALAAEAEPAAFVHDGVRYPFLVRSLPDWLERYFEVVFDGPRGNGVDRMICYSFASL